jgi:hypothetical protein
MSDTHIYTPQHLVGYWSINYKIKDNQLVVIFLQDNIE